MNAKLDKPSGPLQRNRSRLELALGPDFDGLPVATRRQRDVGVEPGRAGNDFEITVGAAPFDAAGDVSAALAPSTPDRAALGDHIGPQVKLVAIAGAGEGLIETTAGFANRIRGAAANALGRTVVEGDGATTGPATGHAGERSRLCVACGAGHRSDQQCDRSEDQSLNDGEAAVRTLRFIGAMLPSDRCKVYLLKPHSTSPIRRCH
jgi:hypothetical protein